MFTQSNEEAAKDYVVVKETDDDNQGHLQDTEILSYWQALKKSFAFCALNTLPSLVATGGNFTNMIILSGIGNDALEAGGLISTAQTLIISTASTALNSIGSTVGRTHGEKQFEKIGLIYKNGLLSAFILSAPSNAFLLSSRFIFSALKKRSALTNIVKDYFNAYAWGVPALLMLTSQRQVCLGTKNTLPVNMVIVSYTALTNILGYVLFHGKFNFPALNFSGLGYASTISAWSNLILFSIYLDRSRRYKDYSLAIFSFKNLFNHIDTLKELLRTGIPMGAQIGCELLALSGVTWIIMGLMSDEELSAHEVGTQYYLLMVAPIFRIGQACGILVGNSIGAEKYANAIKLINMCFLFGMGVTALANVILVSAPKACISLFLDVHDQKNNTRIIKKASKLLSIGGSFHYFDTARAIAGGALQGGFKTTSFPMIAGIFTMSFIPVGMGYILALPVGLGINGIYYARSLGMVSGGIAVCWYLYRKVRKLLRDNSVFESNNLDTPSHTLLDQKREVSASNPPQATIEQTLKEDLKVDEEIQPVIDETIGNIQFEPAKAPSPPQLLFSYLNQYHKGSGKNVPKFQDDKKATNERRCVIL